MREPRDLAEQTEQTGQLPEGIEERFAGYGVMGLPFTSGHVLCMRRFPASSVGSGYTSVWHRNPHGLWTFYSNVPPLEACNRYFGSAVGEAIIKEIQITWNGPRSFTIGIDEENELAWEVQLAPTLATRTMNTVGSLMPNVLWQKPWALSLMGMVASRVLRAGRLTLHGKVPNGQWFIANPRLMWFIVSSKATIRGSDLGNLGPAQPQARLGDFWIPQRGIFVIGRAFFEPFDASRHLSATTSLGANT